MFTLLPEILVVLALLVVNGLFAMSELAVVSARRARLQQRAAEGHRGSARALELAEHPNRFLSTVQIGITLVGIVAGAYGGTRFSAPLAAALARLEPLAAYAEGIAFTLVVAVITYLSLVVGELVPKRLALAAPERVAALVAGPLHGLARLTRPLVRLLSLSTDLVLRLLRVRHEAPTVTEEEVRLLLAEATEAGSFEVAEHEMVQRVFRLGDQTVGSVMTPRHEIVYLDLDDSLEVNREKIRREPHTRFVVCRGGLDSIVGIVNIKRILPHVLAGEPLDLEAHLKEPVYVPEGVAALKVLDKFRSATSHFALVIDEYGGIEGLVTLDDILEAIVGDIPFTGEPVDRDVVERGDGSWLIDGAVTIEHFKDLLGVQELPGEGSGAFRTVAGFAVTSLGRVPVTGDHFEWNGYRLEVVDMDGRRVDKVLVTRLPAAPAGPPGAGP